MRTFGRAAIAGLVIALVAVLAACSSSSSKSGSSSGGASAASSSGGGSGGALPGKGKPAFTLGDKNFAEQYLLGALYQKALQAQGYTVTLKGNLGSSEITDKALTSGKIDGYPEYTGVIYTELAHLGDRPKSAASTLAGATTFETKRGFTVLNADAVPGRRRRRRQQVLRPEARPEDHRRPEEGRLVHLRRPAGERDPLPGRRRPKSAYGLNQIQFKPLTIGTQYQALDQGKIDAIAIFTTDGQLASGKYTVLPDTKGIFGFQQVVPVINKAKLAARWARPSPRR